MEAQKCFDMKDEKQIKRNFDASWEKTFECGVYTGTEENFVEEKEKNSRELKIMSPTEVGHKPPQ